MAVQMDYKNRALCYASRHPPKGIPKTKYTDIQKKVRNKIGRRVTIGAIAQAAKTFKKAKGAGGKKKAGSLLHTSEQAPARVRSIGTG